MKRVFVSYSRHDVESITHLTRDLQAVGLDTWHDNSLTGGQRWWDSILENIRQCDVFIFALSQSSSDSEACRSELSYVVRLGKAILPVLVADGMSTNLLPHPFRDLQCTDYRRRDREATFALVKAVYSAPPTPPLPAVLPEPPPVPGSYLGTLLERVDSAEPLNAQDQAGLLFDLETRLRDGSSQPEVRDLLLKMKRRDDLLAKIAARIDHILQTNDDQTAARAFTASISSHPDRDPQVNAPSTSCDKVVPEPEITRIEIPLRSAQQSGSAHPNCKSRRYKCKATDRDRIVDELKNWLDVQQFASQQMNTEEGAILLQVRKRGKWRPFVGMATALNVVLQHSDSTLMVEVGEGKWIDKAAVGAVSLLVIMPLAFPLLVAAGFGVTEQWKMPNKILDFISTRLVS